MANDNCNTSRTKGCTDDSSYSKLVSTQPKLLSKLVAIESTLDSFSSSLSLYCNTEQQNLTNIKNKLSDVIDVNAECCNIINVKLDELLVAIDAKESCDVHCAIDGYIDCYEATTTTEPTTTA